MTDTPCFSPTVASHTCRVTEHRWVNERYRYLRLESDAALAPATRPGQFYQLKCPTTDQHQPFLLRPMSVYGTGPAEGTLEFLYNVTGEGTRALATLAEGAAMNIVGPLGNTFTLKPHYRHIVLVVRGVGLATLAPLVRHAAAARRDGLGALRRLLQQPVGRRLVRNHVLRDGGGWVSEPANEGRVRARGATKRERTWPEPT